MTATAVTVVAMPRLSDSMEDGIVVAWLVASGAEVTRGQSIVEIETDKATMSYEADAGGWLKTLVDEGAAVSVGSPIAEIHPGPIGRTADLVEPSPEPAATTAPVTVAAAVGPRPLDIASGRSISASPVARRTAQHLQVELDTVDGTGPHGRILKCDVRRAAELIDLPARAEAIESHAPPAPETTTAKGRVERQPLTRLQQTVARRMAESRATAPDFAVTNEIDMTDALSFRRSLQGAAAGKGPSINDLIVKACAQCLRLHPRLNARYVDGAVEIFERINIGVAVAAPGALIVPTIFDADKVSIGEIAAQARSLAEAARAGTIEPTQIAGGTFTISNLGMYGVTEFQAVINPPQAAILSVGAILRRPMFDEHDQVVARNMMSVTLVSDHRVVYGGDAALFLKDLKARMESPLQLAL